MHNDADSNHYDFDDSGNGDDSDDDDHDDNHGIHPKYLRNEYL